MKRLKSEKGQSMVEFAMIIPLLLLIIMGIIEFGLMFNAYLTISNASREAVRGGALGHSDSQIELTVDTVANHLNLDQINLVITPSSRKRGDMLSVTVKYDYTLITPLISNILSPLITLESETYMRVE